MALTDPYVSLEEIKDYLGLSGTGDDEVLTDILDSTTHAINQHCNRQFNQAGAVSARVFEPLSLRNAKVDDFWTTDGLIIETDPGGTGNFTATWSEYDYELSPFNGIVDGDPGWPYWKIRSCGGVWFPHYGTQPFRRKATLRVTANWGWEQVPSPVKQAAKLIAAQTWKMKEAPFGVAGVSNFGSVIRIKDNDAACSKLRKYTFDPILVR